MAPTSQDNPSNPTASEPAANSSHDRAATTSDTHASIDKQSQQILWRAGIGIGVLLILVIALLIWLLPSLEFNFGSESEEEPVSIPADQRTGFFITRGNVTTLGKSGETANPGDLLRFFVSIDEPKHVVILSRDAESVVRAYYPPPETSEVVEANRETLLEGSVEMNDTLGQEQLYFFLCSTSIEIRPLREVLFLGEEPEPPGGCVIEKSKLTKVYLQ